MYPHPGNPERFIPRESSTIPSTPDPGLLPYHALDDTEKRLALKAAALRKVRDHSRTSVKFTVSDGIDALNGRPRHSTVRPLLQDIADEVDRNGFDYDADLPGLKVHAKQALASKSVNEDALIISGWLEERSESTSSKAGADASEATVTESPETEKPSEIDESATGSSTEQSASIKVVHASVFG